MIKRKDRQRYPKVFKLQAVRQSEKPEVSIRHVARELGITDKLLYRWRRQDLTPLP